MRIGAVIGTFGMANVATQIVSEVQRAERDGLDTAWLTQGPVFDAMAVLTAAAAATDRIGLGTAVVPIQLRHAVHMAAGANTVQLASGGRFTLGIGLSHKPYVEGSLGLAFDKPVGVMRSYLDTLIPALDGNVPVMLAALGPQMLKLCGERTNGTITWLTGARTVRNHIVPRLREVSAHAQVLVALPICVTDDVAGARAQADERLAYTAQMPSYRAMMQREGISAPHELALIGGEARVRAALDDLADAGANEFLAIELTFPGEPGERTRALLADYAKAGGRA